ncbi:hypothetical protein BKA14_002605 [Actinoplanes abujensis]|uniref:Uncharacterized protein n=1 Tax=Paractinoplanes abujensis TaxID=882441 RepID=A0A7W7CPQ4_9ACTN|nr:hypothetical protein [Actinoplanes abujensis]
MAAMLEPPTARGNLTTARAYALGEAAWIPPPSSCRSSTPLGSRRSPTPPGSRRPSTPPGSIVRLRPYPVARARRPYSSPDSDLCRRTRRIAPRHAAAPPSWPAGPLQQHWAQAVRSRPRNSYEVHDGIDHPARGPAPRRLRRLLRHIGQTSLPGESGASIASHLRSAEPSARAFPRHRLRARTFGAYRIAGYEPVCRYWSARPPPAACSGTGLSRPNGTSVTTRARAYVRREGGRHTAGPQRAQRISEVVPAARIPHKPPVSLRRARPRIVGRPPAGHGRPGISAVECEGGGRPSWPGLAFRRWSAGEGGGPSWPGLASGRWSGGGGPSWPGLASGRWSGGGGPSWPGLPSGRWSGGRPSWPGLASGRWSAGEAVAALAGPVVSTAAGATQPPSARAVCVVLFSPAVRWRRLTAYGGS